jgi:hypothetical protein
MRYIHLQITKTANIAEVLPSSKAVASTVKEESDDNDDEYDLERTTAPPFVLSSSK